MFAPLSVLAAFAGPGQIRADLGAETALIEASSPDQSKESFHDLTRRVFPSVFGHGS